MRFVPNIADPRYLVTAGMKCNIKILRGKQKSFLKNICKQKSHTIQGLNFHVNGINATLRQVMMGMHSSAAPGSSIFTLPNDDGGTLVATFTSTKHSMKKRNTGHGQPQYFPSCSTISMALEYSRGSLMQGKC
jgi:hypothetical protein